MGSFVSVSQASHCQ
nr:unnamed protein product [Callosobruchus analis]